MLSLFSASPSLNVGIAPVTTARAAISMAPEARAVKATPLPASVKPGVVTGQALTDLLEHAKANKYAIPAVNVVSSCSISSCLEAAKSYGGPMISQFSRGGGQFICGKTADNTDDAACIAGTVAVRAFLFPNARCSTR
jgi:fructose-bisphosphate aldolase class II